MVLQLRELFQIEGMRFPIEYQIMPEELSGVHGYTFDGPVTVKGMFRNRAGIVTLQYTVSCVLHVVCDRCLQELTREYSYDFSHTVVPSLQSEGDVYDTYESDSNLGPAADAADKDALPGGLQGSVRYLWV